MNNVLKEIISISIPLLVGFSGSFFTVTGPGSWYTTIQKPEWNPPGWIFGPVWTTLYIMMGIALFLVWKEEENAARKKTAIIFFGIQMVLNFAWSFIFFGQHRIGLALVDIILLWLAILITIFLFARINRAAAWLLVPYISWVSFAALLNYTIWQLNPGS